MKIPGILRIGGIDYPVKWTGKDWQRDTGADGMHYAMEVLKIAKSCRSPVETLIHEMIHAICNQCYLEHKEKLVWPLAIMLTRALQDAGLLKDVTPPKEE